MNKDNIFADEPFIDSNEVMKYWVICQLDKNMKIVRQAALPFDLEEPFTVGRSVDCDFTIDDPSKKVSRVHAVISEDRRGIFISEIDESSQSPNYNGIRFSGACCTKIYLKDKMYVYLAETPVGFYIAETNGR